MGDEEFVVEFWFEVAPPPATDAIFDVVEVKTAVSCDEARLLGRGSFGETWWAKKGADETVFKIIHRENYPVPRLEREIEGLRRGESANLVPFRGFHVLELRGKPRPTLEFGYVAGGNVLDRLLADGWPEPNEILAFGSGVLAGVVALHGNNTIHRDIKPENVALADGAWTRPVILDLGLAKMLDLPSVTMYPALMGTPAFMAPEQVRGDRARKGADIWAVGAMLFLLAARRHPFYGPYDQRVDRDEALDMLLSGPPAVSDDVSPGLGALIERMLSPESFERGSSRRALRDLRELERNA